MQSLAAWDKFVNSLLIPGNNIRRVLKISFHIKQMLCTGRGSMVIHMRGVCPAHSGQKIIHKMVQAGVHILCGKAAVLVRPSGVKIRRDGALKSGFQCVFSFRQRQAMPTVQFACQKGSREGM